MKSQEAESNDRRNNYDDVTPEELKDPMSGYASADALASEAPLNRNEDDQEEGLKDPMSGYASADALGPSSNVNDEGVDNIHTDEMKDAMSGYASADALESDVE